jgi:hypothetical protein
MTRSRSTPASTPADGGARAATPARTVALVPATLALVVVLGGVGAPGTAAAQSDRPTVEVVGGTVAGGDATTVRVVLTAAPDGLAGYYLRLSVADPEVARFANASYPDRFGMTTEPELGDDGRTVALEAADLDGSVEPGATDVTLATVAVSGVAPGEARVTVDPIQLDADGGSAIDATTRAAEITVTPDGGSDADESAAGTDGDDASDDAAGGADAGNGDAAGADAGDPDGDRAGSGAAGPGVASVLLVAGAGTLLAVGLLIGRRL